MSALEHLAAAYWPLWYPLAAFAAGLLAAAARRAGARRLRRARRSLSELEVARAGRPSPAPIDVEPRR